MLRRRAAVVSAAAAADRDDDDDDDDAETEDGDLVQLAVPNIASTSTSTTVRRQNARVDSPCTVRSAIRDVVSPVIGHDIQPPDQLRLQQTTYAVYDTIRCHTEIALKTDRTCQFNLAHKN